MAQVASIRHPVHVVVGRVRPETPGKGKGRASFGRGRPSKLNKLFLTANGAVRSNVLTGQSDIREDSREYEINAI